MATVTRDLRDALTDGVSRDPAGSGELGMLEDLLRVVQDEAAEDGHAAVRRDILKCRERAHRHAWHEHRGETGADQHAETSEQWATDPEILRHTRLVSEMPPL